MKTIIISAYSVNPFEGSEAGTGWNIVNELSKDNKLIVITRKNNLPAINAYLNSKGEHHHQNLEFYGYDLPSVIMKWKKKLGERGYVLYFYLWQLFLPFFIKKHDFKFDIAHALNFHSDSHPTFLWLFGKPTVWGPIGHHPLVPKEFMDLKNGHSNFIKDRLYYAIKWAMRNLDPLYFISKKMVKKVFVINSTIGKVVGAAKSKTEILSAVASEKTVDFATENRQEFNVLSVGRFHYMKGFDVAIKAYSRFLASISERDKKRTKLWLVGKGPEEKNLRNLIDRLGIAENVRIINWVEKSEMNAIYKKSSVFLFPSHEGAGMVIPEALSYGIPSITFNNAGPGELAGVGALKVDYGDYELSVKEFGKHLTCLFANPLLLKNHRERALKQFNENFTWEQKAKTINKAYADLLPQKTIAVFHPSSELYGADRILVNALEALPKELRKIVYLKFNGDLVDFIPQHIHNVSVKSVPYMPVIYRAIFTPKGILNFGIDWFRFAAFFFKENRKYKFISAYVNTLSTSLISPILKLKNIRHFIHVHEIIEQPKFIGKLTAVLSRLFASSVVCVSEAVKENLVNYIPSIEKKITVLHNGISALTVNASPKDDKINLYLFGRIMEKKGHWFLLDSLKLLSNEIKNKINIVLMGGAAPGKMLDLERLNAEIKSNKLEKIVSIKGFEKSIDSAMEKADICLVPSIMKDPFPTTVLEAMSAGKPVIATNHGGAKEAVNDSNCGILIQPGATNELANAITHLVKNKSQIGAMGAAAKKRFERHFTKSIFNQKWLNFNIEQSFI